MYVNTYHHFSSEVIIMDKIKSMAYLAIGAASMAAFERYKEPITKAMKKMLNKETKMMNKLEDMM